jgi:hypothetical protein
MSKNVFRKFWSFSCLVGIFLLVGCGGGGAGTGTTDTKADAAKDFSSTNAVPALNNSVVSIPANLKVTNISASGKNQKASKDNGTDDSIGVNFYGIIQNVLSFSGDTAEGIEKILSDILESQVLVTSETGKIIPVTDGGKVTAYMLEDTSSTSGEDYKWKLSLYFDSTIPDMIFRFTFKDEKMKGLLLANIKESKSFIVNGLSTTLVTTYVVKVHFDGIESTKKLDIDYVADLATRLAFAEANWKFLTEDQKDSLDIGQAGKASFRVQFDGKEYGLSGSGYSPGSNLKSSLNGDDNTFGEDRSTFTFRAKSINGEVDGAKMDVAVPLNTLANVSTIWETDSISTVFQERLLGFMNNHLNKMIDATNDTVEEDNNDFAGTTLEEQRLGFYTLYWFFGDELAIPTFAKHGSVMTETEFNNALNFWGIDSFSTNGISKLDDLNAILASNDVSITEAAKVGLYYNVMAPAVIAYYQANPVVLTIPEVDSILNKTSDSESKAFSAFIQTIKHLVNPAFFEKEKGFLGTFDGTNFYTYTEKTNSLTLGSKPANFTVLNALDLTNLEAIIPNDVYTRVIEVK